MTAKDLKKMLAGVAGVPDEMEVLIPETGEFNGVFRSPCMEDTGVIELGLEDLDEEEIAERNLLNQPPKTEKSFVIVPCGFYETSKEDHIHELN